MVQPHHICGDITPKNAYGYVCEISALTKQTLKKKHSVIRELCAVNDT